MGLLVLAFVSLAICFTILLVGLKLLWLAAKVLVGLVLLPLKVMGGALDGTLALAFLPIKLGLVLALVFGSLLFVFLFPILALILVVATILYFQRVKPAAS